MTQPHTAISASAAERTTPPGGMESHPVQKGIPPSLNERRRLLDAAREYIAETAPVPPLPMDQLRAHASRLMQSCGCAPEFEDYLLLLINNELWRDQLAGVPFDRRLLLLPKCLRNEARCPAAFDELGMLCENCGLCAIQDLSTMAENLGYAVLVAEGSAAVMNLIRSGKIEAVIGVSCLSVLRKAFPHMEAAAVPGIAIPLLQEGCKDTTVDVDCVKDYLRLTADEQSQRLDLGRLRREAASCFEPSALDAIMGPAASATEQIARDWLAKAGKRWRPFLTLAVCEALGGPNVSTSDDLRRAAVAVECFHKASLIHDDIEDNDAMRYGKQTLHTQYGVPVALNAGDLLIGEGYRVLSLCVASSDARVQMLNVASAGQRELCRGQGAELLWTRRPVPLSSGEVLDIFRQKTAPAFEVALRLGKILAGYNGACDDVLVNYSRALGVAYQIRDDLTDFGFSGETNDISEHRPSLLLAVGCERATGPDRDWLESLWRGEIHPDPSEIQNRCLRLGAKEECLRLLSEQKMLAINSLNVLANADLKKLLRRVAGRIFNEIEFTGWCSEQKKINAQNTVKKTMFSSPTP